VLEVVVNRTERQVLTLHTVQQESSYFQMKEYVAWICWIEDTEIPEEL
jgi:hypothetical protein